MHVTSRSHKINYLTSGSDGTAFVLIHGHLQAAEDWFDAGYPALLGDRCRVIAIDMLGYGDSDKPDDVASHALGGRVTDVLAVMDAEGIDQAVIWGYSLGVFTAEAFAKEHPARTTAYVAGGNVVGLTPRDRENICLEGADQLERLGVRAYVETWPFMPADRIDMFVGRNDAGAAAAAARGSSMRHDAEDAPLPSSTFNYVGTAETWFDVAAAVAADKGVDFAPIEGADHSQAFQKSADVCPMVLEFLTRRS